MCDQRSLIGRALHEAGLPTGDPLARCGCGAWPCATYAEEYEFIADELMKEGVRVVDAKTLANAILVAAPAMAAHRLTALILAALDAAE